jgi:hypothetical protein
MKITLTEDLFVGNEYSVSYGMNVAKFSIVDENYASGSALAAVDRIICVIQIFDGTGAKLKELFGSLVVGLGDYYMNVTSDNPAYLGKLMNKDNMAECVVEFYE